MLSLPLGDGKTLDIGVRTSARARHFRLISSIRGVEAVVPANYSVDRLEEFVKSRRDWIATTSQYYSRLKERAGHDGPDIVYFLGEKYRYRIVKDRLQSAVVSEALRHVTFHVTDRRSYKRQIRQWYSEQTSHIIAERLPALAGIMGLQYSKVSVKNHRSRWASCSKGGNLNFNLLLAAAPPAVIDYVIIHELAHTVEMNHSGRFWSIVEKADPDFKKHRAWLAYHSPVIGIESL